MKNQTNTSQKLSRRQFLKLGGGLAAAVAGAGLLKNVLRPAEIVRAQSALQTVSNAPQLAGSPLHAAAPDKTFAASDGWIYLPGPAVGGYFPDDLAPAPFNTYMFGFRDVSGLSNQLIFEQKGKAQAMAPLFYMDEGVEYWLRLVNLGLGLRPDLVDSHTVHFHGFRNAIPMFDGEPASSLAAPIGRDLTYVYKPHDAGTYMYHCHFEDTEHVHMGMVGPVFIRPAQNNGVPALSIPAGKYAYNDGVVAANARSTAYDREYVMFLSEVWAFAHWADSHIQLPEWTDYRPEHFLLNGRTYPDTLVDDGGGNDPLTGDLIAPAGRPDLQYQPYSALVKANAGERVLLRFMNLGFQIQSMTLGGLKMKVVGKDANLLRGRDGTDLIYYTNTISIGPGESVDVIVTIPTPVAPPVGQPYVAFPLYNRNLARSSNGGGAGNGGQRTEIRAFPAGTLPAQLIPNT